MSCILKQHYVFLSSFFFYHEMVVLQSFSQFTETRFTSINQWHQLTERAWLAWYRTIWVRLPTRDALTGTHLSSLDSPSRQSGALSATLPLTSEMNPKNVFWSYRLKTKQQCRFQCNILIAFKIWGEWFLYINVHKCWKCELKFECSRIIKISWFFCLIDGGSAAKVWLGLVGENGGKKASYIYIRHMSQYIAYCDTSIIFLSLWGIWWYPTITNGCLVHILKVWLIAWRKK